MGQNCCSPCNTNILEVTTESDEGEQIKSQLKFLNKFQIVFLLQADQFKYEFLKQLNSKQSQQSMNKVNLQSIKVQCLMNDSLGLYVEQQFSYSLNYHAGFPLIIANLMTNESQFNSQLQSQYSINQSHLNIIFQEFHGNKFIHSQNDRILSQYCSVQLLKEILICSDNCIKNAFTFNKLINNNFINQQQDQEIINDIQEYQQLQDNFKNIYQNDQTSQQQQDQFIFIPIINPLIQEITGIGNKINIIDNKNQKLIGYNNIEYVFKLIQILYKSINIIQQQQKQSFNKNNNNHNNNSINLTNSINNSLQNIQNNRESINNPLINPVISILVIKNNQKLNSSQKIIHCGQLKIKRYLFIEEQQFIIKQRVFYPDQVVFILAEQKILSKQYLSKPSIISNILSSNFDLLIINLRKVLHDHINKIFLTSSKEMQQSELFEEYLNKSIIYFLSKQQNHIYQICTASYLKGNDNKYFITNKNNSLKPQEVINMSNYADYYFSICSNIIFSENIMSLYSFDSNNRIQKIENQQEQIQQFQQIIGKIISQLQKIPINNNQQILNNVYIDSENFYTENIQEQQNEKIQKKQQSVLRHKQNQNIIIGQDDEEEYYQKYQNILQSSQQKEINSTKTYTPIQDNNNNHNPLSTKSFSAKNSDLIINSLPISPQNLNTRINFSTPAQMKFFQSANNFSQKHFNDTGNNNKSSLKSSYKTPQQGQFDINDIQQQNYNGVIRQNEKNSDQQISKNKNVQFFIGSTDLKKSNNDYDNIIIDNLQDDKIGRFSEAGNGYDSPTFLSSKNINSSFNVIDSSLQQDQMINLASSQIKQIQNNDFDKLRNSKGLNNSRIDQFQKSEIYHRKLDQFLGCIFGTFLGDSMGSYIRNNKSFSVKDIQISMSMNYPIQNLDSYIYPGQLSEWQEISLEIGYALSRKDGVFDQKDIIINLIEWFDSRPQVGQEYQQKQFMKVLKQVSSEQDEIKVEDLYKRIQQMCQKDYKDQSQIDQLGSICFLCIFTSAILDEDMIKIFKSQLGLFNTSQDYFLLHVSLAFAYTIKQLFNSKSDRKTVFQKTLIFCQNYLKDQVLIELLSSCIDPIMKIFDQNTIQNMPLHFITYFSFYIFYHDYSFESALQQIYSYGGDTCFYGSIVGCLIGASTGYSKLPQQQLQILMNFNPEKVKQFKRPEKYLPKYGYEIAEQILSFYFSPN